MTTHDTLKKLREQLKRHEGAVTDGRGNHKPYHCPAGRLTIGYGRNIEERGITDAEAEHLLDSDIIKSTSELTSALRFYSQMDDVHKAVLINMHFNMGLGRLLGFRKMLEAIERGDYSAAAAEMLDSRWARQIGRRAAELADQMRAGVMR